ncbi:thioredoxin [Candidatus Aerophobetes bacterium]|nr:thioredoxin [Candidatus Aerophobetes bacterium]
MAEKTFTDENWEEEVLNSTIPVIIDFWAEWCMPCHIMSPIVEEMAEKYDGKIKVGKLNVDENPNTARRYMIMGIPTLLFFNEGKLVDKIVGVTPKKVVEDKIKKLL